MVLTLSFFAMKGIGQQKQLKDLAGRWEVFGDKDNNATLEVIDSSTILLTYNGEKKKLTNYKIDFAKSPIWFDFSTEGDSSSTIAVKSIIEIVNESMIKWQLFVDEERTPFFSSSKGELFYLRKTRSAITTSVVSN